MRAVSRTRIYRRARPGITVRWAMMNTPTGPSQRSGEGVGVARTKARVLASIRALPTLPRANHAAKTFLSLLTNMTVFRIGQFQP
jgi:hypothetical protein